MISAIANACPGFSEVTYDDIFASYPDAENALGVIHLLSYTDAAKLMPASEGDAADAFSEDLDLQISFVIDNVVTLGRKMDEFHEPEVPSAFVAEAVRLALLITTREALTEADYLAPSSHAPDQRLLEEGREPRLRGRAPHDVLQLRPHPSLA